LDEEFIKAFKETDSAWLVWLGMPVLYDGALNVCRDKYDVLYRKKYIK